MLRALLSSIVNRKVPPERHPLPPKKKLFMSTSTYAESVKTIVFNVESPCETFSNALIDEPNQNIKTNESNYGLNAVDYRSKLEEK